MPAGERGGNRGGHGSGGEVWSVGGDERIVPGEWNRSSAGHIGC